jgi:6,7-dimethyl-8-ribityllumazine synthase
MADISNSKLFEIDKGIHKLKDAFVVMVKTEWNAAIVDELENKCIEVLHRYNVSTKTIVVPGAIEIPFAIKQYWQLASKKNQPQAFIALGCVVRGGTPHFDYVCQAVTYGISQLNISLPVPLIFCVLTVDNMQQAEDRIGGIHGHKGDEAALTTIKMILLNMSLQKNN